MPVRANEIEPGIVVHVDPAKLRAHGGCSTVALPGKETRQEHFFLVVSVDDELCLCTPLLSEKDRGTSRDWVRLNPDLKSGKPETWTDDDSYFFKWQFWRVPRAALEAASETDDSEGSRRWYAKDNADELNAASAHLANARHPWRPI